MVINLSLFKHKHGNVLHFFPFHVFLMPDGISFLTKERTSNIAKTVSLKLKQTKVRHHNPINAHFLREFSATESTEKLFSGAIKIMNTTFHPLWNPSTPFFRNSIFSLFLIFVENVEKNLISLYIFPLNDLMEVYRHNSCALHAH